MWMFAAVEVPSMRNGTSVRRQQASSRCTGRDWMSSAAAAAGEKVYAIEWTRRRETSWCRSTERASNISWNPSAWREARSVTMTKCRSLL